MNDINIQIGAILESNTKSKLQTELNKYTDISLNVSDIRLNGKALQDVQKILKSANIKLDLQANLDRAILANQGQQAGQIIKNGINKAIQKGSFENLKIFKTDDLNKAAEEAEKTFKKISGSVSIIENFDSNKGLNGFIVQCKNADGVVEKLKYTLNETKKQFEYIGGSLNNNGVEKQFESISSKANDLSARLEKIKSAYSDLNAPKAIKDQSHLTELNNQYLKVKNAIEAVKTSDSSTFSSMTSNANKEIAVLESLISKFKNAKYTATSLRTKDIATIKIDEGNKLNVFVEQIKQSGLYTSELKTKIFELQGVLSKVFDSAGLTTYLNQLSNVESEYKAIKEATKTEEKTKLLQSNIEAEKNKLSNYRKELEATGNISNELRQKMEALQNSLKNVTTQGELKIWISDFQALKAEADGTNEAFKRLASAEQLALRKDNIKSNIDQFLAQNTRMTDELRSKFIALKNAIDSTDDGTALANIRTQLSTLKNEAKATGQIGKSLLGVFTENVGKFSQWLIAGNSMMFFYRAIKDGVGFVTELDSALATINMTMPVTSSELQQLGTDSIKVAKDLKTSATEVLNAVAIYANANETSQSILAKAAPTIMLSTASGIDTASSADIIQGALNQFDLAEDQAIHVADVYEKVSENIAVDFKRGINEIAQAIQVSGSVAKDAGLELEEYASMVAKVVEQTRLSGSTVGTAFRTMFTRLTKSGSGEATEEDISKAETALRAVGVEVREDVDTFRDMRDILGDLAKKWDVISDVQKSNIAYEVAGTRQTSIFKSLMNSYDEYLNLVDSANEAAGTTYKNQEIYEKTIKSDFKELIAVTQEFWDNVIDTRTVKTAITIVTDLVKVLDKLVDIFGLLGTVGAGVGIYAFVKNLDWLECRATLNLA